MDVENAVEQAGNIQAGRLNPDTKEIGELVHWNHFWHIFETDAGN